LKVALPFRRSLFPLFAIRARSPAPDRAASGARQSLGAVTTTSCRYVHIAARQLTPKNSQGQSPSFLFMCVRGKVGPPSAEKRASGIKETANGRAHDCAVVRRVRGGYRGAVLLSLTLFKLLD
jgi:hypothetical protein